MIDVKKHIRVLPVKGELSFEVFEGLPVMAAMSYRSDGNMSLEGGETAAVNRGRFLMDLGVVDHSVFHAAIRHGSIVGIVHYDDPYLGGVVNGIDGLVTSCADIFLSVGAADCPPIFIFDPVKKIAGLLHAGWRGISRGIIRNAIQTVRLFNSDFRDIRAGVGPCICQGHYEFGEDALKLFGDVSEAVAEVDGRHHLNLRKVAVHKLLEAGVRPENISVSDTCTFCDESMFSYRREGENYGVMMTVFGMLSS